MAEISRRAFLKLAGASTAAAALYHSSGSILAALKLIDETTPPGQEVWLPSVCQLCPAGCGILARVVSGLVVKIEGNPLNPNNQGRLCPKGQAGLQQLYHPDRVKGPLQRVGERGSGDWKSISWDEALTLVVDRLSEMREGGQPHSLVFMHDAKPGLLPDFVSRFCQAFGTPNAVAVPSTGANGSAPLAHHLMHGRRAPVGYDWENTNHVLSFGSSFLEARQPSVRMLQAYSRLRRGRPNARARIVQIESRFSITAAKADEWIPIEPGTMGALALSMARVILEEGLYDNDFVENYTFGFEDWTDEAGQEHIGFKTLVLSSHSPATVAPITGVPAETIQRLARDFASTRPAVALADASWQTNGLYTQMAVHALNAMVGSIDIPGGLIRQEEPPFTPWPDIVKDDLANQGLSMPRMDRAGTRDYPLATGIYEALPANILAEDPYPVGALFVSQANPLFCSPEPNRYARALENVPFIVSFAPFLDDSSSSADLVLPGHSYLEAWNYDELVPSLGYPVVALGQPVAEPLYDTRSTVDVLIELAQRLGGTVGQSFTWQDAEAVLHYRLRGIFEAARGSIVVEPFDRFWEELLERGVWSAPPYRFGEWRRTLTTPSGRFEFYSQNLKHALESVAAQEAAENGSAIEESAEVLFQDLGLRARGDEVYLPHYEFPRWVGDEVTFPFHLNVYESMSLLDGRVANLPWLQEIVGLHIKEMWGNWVEINPKTAAELGIADKDLVWVESPVGRIRLQARLYPGAMPHVVNIALGQGHESYGRWATQKGENPLKIIAHEPDRLGGVAARLSTRVNIYKA